MRLTIAAVGKLKDDADRDICVRYVKRFCVTGRAIGLGPLEIVELAESRLPSSEARKNDEAARLLKITGTAGLMIALDVTGRTMTSEEFAALLARERDAGIKQAALLIGGPDGHGGGVLAQSKVKLSLSAMTLPHGLARIVLAEQLYRAATILSGHPYHRA